MSWLVVLLLLVWIYVLYTMKRAQMGVWYFICGSVGLFVFSMIIIEPHAVGFLQKSVTAVAGVLGEATGMYDSYFQQGMLFIDQGKDSLSLYVDFECSGVIEILAFLSLLWFFQVYDAFERIVITIVGTLSIFILNVLRIYIICTTIHIWGSDIYFLAHTVIGRIFFYVGTVILYFYVFTKAQIVRQKVGAFRYERN